MNFLGIGSQERFDASERFAIAGCVATLRVLRNSLHQPFVVLLS